MQFDYIFFPPVLCSHSCRAYIQWPDHGQAMEGVWQTKHRWIDRSPFYYWVWRFRQPLAWRQFVCTSNSKGEHRKCQVRTWSTTEMACSSGGSSCPLYLDGPHWLHEECKSEWSDDQDYPRQCMLAVLPLVFPSFLLTQTGITLFFLPSTGTTDSEYKKGSSLPKEWILTSPLHFNASDLTITHLKLSFFTLLCA